MFTALNSKLSAVRNRIASGEKGFTLIELLIVVLIIGVLAAIAIPIYLTTQQGAKDNAAKTTVTDAKTNVVAAFTNEGLLPANKAAITAGGFSPASDIAWEYLPGTDLANGTVFCIAAQYTDGGAVFVTTGTTGTEQATEATPAAACAAVAAAPGDGD